MPLAEPDPAFVAFFDTTFSEMLRAVSIPGWPTASWDRKAAWLLWQTLNGQTPPAPPQPDNSAFD